MDVKAFIIENWRNAEALSTLLGAESDKTTMFYFGSFPQEQAFLKVTYGKITRITTWSGVGWTPLQGYGNPTVDVWL